MGGAERVLGELVWGGKGSWVVGVRCSGVAEMRDEKRVGCGVVGGRCSGVAEIEKSGWWC